MIDPVVMDLNRHMAQLDRETQIEEAAEELEQDILHDPELLGEALGDMTGEQWSSLYTALSLLATAKFKDEKQILESAKRVRREVMEAAERSAVKQMERCT